MADAFWDNRGGWMKAMAAGRDHLHIKRSAGQAPVCRRCGITAAGASAEAHTGAMLALVPTEADRKRLAVAGGEAAEELHLTLCFMGGDASMFPPDQVQRIVGAAHLLAADLEPLTANIFGVAHWNGQADTAAWVWNVGDGQHSGPPAPGECLHDFHEAAETICMIAGCDDLPDQYCPWSPHICALYSKDLTVVRDLEKRLGPVTFDRLWVAIGDQDVYIPLGGAMTAAGLLRRQPTDTEVRSGVDFALVDRNWTAAVNGAVDALASQLYAWRYHLREQLVAAFAANQPTDLSHLAVDTSQAEATLYDLMVRMANTAGRQMEREAASQGVAVPHWTLDDDTVTAALRGTGFLRSAASISVGQLASNLVQSAKNRALRLFGSNRPPEQAADSVSRDLAQQSPARTRETVAAAMTSAQNTGRMAVLSVAEPAVYTATEALDKNSCSPCRAVDGTEYTSLSAAREAYPNGGYANCQGGGRCRGMLVADWSRNTDITASAAAETGGTVPPEISHPTEAPAVTTETEQLAKGKPSKGTPKDKRLKENMYTDDAGHFGPSQSTTSAPWNGAASNYTDQQYRSATAACDPGGTAKEACFLPHHTPGGALSLAGLAAAAGRANQLSGHDPAAVARAKAHLRGHYRALNKPVPDNLAATAQDIEAAGVEEGYETTVFVLDDGTEFAKGGMCGPGQKMGPGGKCVSAKVGNATAGEAEAMAATEAPAAVPEVSDNTAPWRGPLTVEGIETGDGREFDAGALTWADLPLPLRWNKEDSHGGQPHTVAVNVGRIDKVWREDSGLIMGEGVLDLGTEDGTTVHGKIKGQFLRGVSVDVDSIKDADMELIWPDQPDGPGDPDDEFARMFAAPEKTVFHKGRIRAATLVDIPAFAEAYIALLDEAGAVTAGGEPIGALRASMAPRYASTAVKARSRAPQAWYDNPDLSVPTPITVTEDGRVYGHAALWGTCHVGQPGMCVTPPREDSHPYFMTGDAWTEEGTSVSVGQITVGTGHASLNMDHRQASEHYDNTGAAVADVAVGNDAHGIWVAGAVRPSAGESRVHDLRAAGQVSGDWRRIGGALRLVGLLAVNVPGFPVPKLRTHYAGGSQLALVASGIPHLGVQLTESELDQWAYRRVLEILSRDVNGEE